MNKVTPQPGCRPCRPTGSDPGLCAQAAVVRRGTLTPWNLIASESRLTRGQKEAVRTVLLSDDGKEERRERDETERRERATPPVDADTQRLLDDWNAYADDASRAEGASPRARVPPVDYRDKLPPRPWCTFTPPAPVHFYAAVDSSRLSRHPHRIGTRCNRRRTGSVFGAAVIISIPSTGFPAYG